MGNSNLALVEHTTQTGDEQPPRKYKYQEFDGPRGEEYLNVLLQQILPFALWRTWHWAVSFQAPGYPLYVSASKLAERVRPGERKVYLDLQELEARHLLQITHKRIPILQQDGSTSIRVVTVKDFERLYDLAHEYHEWIHSPDYLPPTKECIDLIQAMPDLVRKLIRFDNYRRLLLCKKPGRKSKPKEAHSWYSSESDQDCAESQSPVQGHGTGDPKLNLYFNGRDKGDSPKRISTDSPSNNPLNKDSFDSEVPSNKGKGGKNACSQERGCSQKDYTKERESEKDTARADSSSLSPTQTKPTNPIPTASVKSGTKQSTRRESAELEPAVRLARQAMALAQGGQPGRMKRRYAGNGKPRPKDNALVSSFLKEIGPLFHDKNLKGSITRALRIVQDFGLVIDTDIMTCLVRAYKVARDTHTVREAHKNEDGSANKMPLFLAMLRTFAEAYAQGKSHYTEEDLVADIVEDDRLVLWLAECGLQLEVLSDPAAAQSEVLAEATITQDGDQEVTTTSEAGETEASLPQKEVSIQEQQGMQATRRIRSAEDKQARADYARKVRAKLRKEGVSEMFAAMVDTEHPCGCPLFWDTERGWNWKCAHCKPHPGWSGEVRKLIASILEQ